MHRIVLLLTIIATIIAGDSGADPGSSRPAPGSGGGGGGTGAPPSDGGMSWAPLVFIGLMVLMMWFMVIRPQKKEEKRRKELVDAIKRGDEVVTIGGVHAVVEAVGETTVDVRIGKGSESVVATFNKGAVSTNLTAERANKTA
ncbi:MAG: preprotein translocase subunit YajC [Planctomycetota bacterium]